MTSITGSYLPCNTVCGFVAEQDLELFKKILNSFYNYSYTYQETKKRDASGYFIDGFKKDKNGRKCKLSRSESNEVFAYLMGSLNYETSPRRKSGRRR